MNLKYSGRLCDMAENNLVDVRARDRSGKPEVRLALSVAGLGADSPVAPRQASKKPVSLSYIRLAGLILSPNARDLRPLMI
jgi:hypothetical protein